MVSARRVGTNENVSTYGDGTRDYTSLAVWEAATDIDLVTAAQSEALECYDDAVFDDTVTISGGTTDSNYFRIIRPALGEKHDGTPNTGVRFVQTLAVNVFTLSESFLQIQDIVASRTTASEIIFALNSNNITVVGCISNLGNRGFSSSGTDNEMVDCVAANQNQFGFFVPGGNAIIYNCDAINCTTAGIRVDAPGVLIAKNNLSSGNGLDFEGTFAAGTVTNASSDTTASGTGSRTEQTFTFVDAVNDDYHLASSDEGALNFGTDLSADATFPFDDDIDGDLWGDTWSIGFDQFIAVVSSSVGFIHSVFRRRRRNH